MDKLPRNPSRKVMKRDYKNESTKRLFLTQNDGSNWCELAGIVCA